MIFPKLYKYTTRGQIQEWQIFCPPDENYYYTVEGIQNGKQTTSEPTFCSGKNIGKSNETTEEQQTLLEAQSKYQKKLDSGYSTDIATSGAKFFEPMLAQDFSKYSKLLFTVRTFIQPKLDGVRASLNNGELLSRKGKPIVSCKHIEHDYFRLDGELYNHTLKNNFNKIVSLVRQTKPTESDLLESASIIQYWIYDYPFYADKVFSERYELLKKVFRVFPDQFKLVPTYEITSMEELKQYHQKFIEDGYEGSIIRLDLGPYENKRSKQLLKYKDWQDDEFEIIGVLEGSGNRAGCANMLEVKLPTNAECKPTMTGSEDFMREVWANRDKIIGKFATIKYFGYTEDGSLRFPTVKAIRDYE